jgi:hypothetical protein
MITANMGCWLPWFTIESEIDITWYNMMR